MIYTYGVVLFLVILTLSPWIYCVYNSWRSMRTLRNLCDLSEDLRSIDRESPEFQRKKTELLKAKEAFNKRHPKCPINQTPS